jgi:hypothetical protein
MSDPNILEVGDTMKPNKVIKKQTRQLIADEMTRHAMTEGWHETPQNPRMPDAEIAVATLEAVTVIARTLASRQDPTADVTRLAAVSVSWLQNLTYTDKKSWT